MSKDKHTQRWVERSKNACQCHHCLPFSRTLLHRERIVGAVDGGSQLDEHSQECAVPPEPVELDEDDQLRLNEPDTEQWTLSCLHPAPLSRSLGDAGSMNDER